MHPLRPPRRWRGPLVAVAVAAVRGSALAVGDAPTTAEGRPCPRVARQHGRCHPVGWTVPPAASPDGRYFDCSASTDFMLAYEREPGEALRGWECGELDAVLLNRRRTIACIGDSTTHGLNVSRGEEYPSVLHRLLNKQFPKQFNVINLGVTASTARHNGSHSYWGFPQWSIAAEVRIDVAVVMLGINDADGTRWAKAEYVQDYLTMVHDILRLHSNATIFVAVPPQGAYAFKREHLVQRGVIGELRRTRRDLAGAVEEVRREAHLETPAINFYDAFAWAVGRMRGAEVHHPGPNISVDDLYLEDGIHPSALGYNEMAVAASAAISKDAMSPRGFCLRCQASAHPDQCREFCARGGHATA